jgi:hypothetical protein
MTLDILNSKQSVSSATHQEQPYNFMLTVATTLLPSEFQTPAPG